MADIKISALPTATTPLTGAELVPVVQGGVTKQTTATAIFTAGVLPVVNGGTGTATPALVPGSNVTITGTWPNQTINSTSSATVTNVSVVSANGLAGTVANPTTTPAITLSTSVTGIVKGNGTTLSAASAGTDYVAPGGALGTPSSGTVTNLTGTASININGTVGATTPAAGTFTSQNNGQLAGLRNRIINGAMTIDQRNAGAAVTPTATGYILDRFAISISQASKLTIQQVSDAPTGFKYSTKLLVATQYSPTAAEVFTFYQPIEGFNCIDLAFGTASATTVCVSLWVKGSVAGTYSVSLRNGTAARSYVGTVSVTTSWVKQTITLTGDLTGTWLTDSGAGLYLTFDLGSGTNFNTTAGSWQAGNFTRTAGSVSFVNQTAGATLNITGVQLEIGSTATPFEQRPYGMELALCQRYYQQINLGAGFAAPFTGFNQSTTSVYYQVPFKTTQRAVPVFSTSSVSGFSVNSAAGSTSTTNLILSNGTIDGCFLFATTSAQTAGYGTSLSATSTTQYLGFSAEL